jgi:hypothetical protein
MTLAQLVAWACVTMIVTQMARAGVRQSGPHTRLPKPKPHANSTPCCTDENLRRYGASAAGIPADRTQPGSRRCLGATVGRDTSSPQLDTPR